MSEDSIIDAQMPKPKPKVEIEEDPEVMKERSKQRLLEMFENTRPKPVVKQPLPPKVHVPIFASNLYQTCNNSPQATPTEDTKDLIRFKYFVGQKKTSAVISKADTLKAVE